MTASNSKVYTQVQVKGGASLGEGTSQQGGALLSGQRVSDHGDKYRTGALWGDFPIMPGADSFLSVCPPVGGRRKGEEDCITCDL